MKPTVAIISDAAEPYVNGVVRTLEQTVNHLKKMELADPILIEPRKFHGKYREMKEMDLVSFSAFKELEAMFTDIDFDYIHISTEGPLGYMARKICVKRNWKFTTAYHTKFPEYFHMRYPFIPVSLGYHYFRWFHDASSKIMVATESLRTLLHQKEFFSPTGIWTRGVDTELYNPNKRGTCSTPYALYVGRVSKEKSIEEFLEAATPGLDKVVVGDGPLRPSLERKFSSAYFTGKQTGEALARLYANADVFCFPSETDTFGLVMIEALASGVPVAAKPCSEDIINSSKIGGLSTNMTIAIDEARYWSDKERCRSYVLEHHTWEIATKQFFDNLIPKTWSVKNLIS